jgi:hypothetical protein
MRRKLLYLLLAAVSFGFTAFVYLNTYEVLADRQVPFGIALQRMAGQAVINNAIREFAAKPGNVQGYVDISKLDDMQYFEIPSLRVRVSLESGRKINGEWFQRPSLAEFLGLNKNDQGIPIDCLIYTAASWRTIPDPAQVEPGMAVTIFHKGGDQSRFHVVEKQVASFDRSFLVDKTNSRQILLLVEEPKYGAYYGYSLAQDT